MRLPHDQSTVCALSTPPGAGAIALIRITGKEALAIISAVFSKNLHEAPARSVHFGTIRDGQQLIDEVLVTVFRAPHSFTGEEVVEIACHGSRYIQQKILQLLLRQGCRAAEPGEFTLRAFLNRKMDLSQAEAVADLVASESEAAHRLAMQQVKGGFSSEIARLREDLIHFASLVELELDFAEEDVEFADRPQLTALIDRLSFSIRRLVDSFALGNVIKHGIPVAIVGVPNVGKSTLLNTLLQEDRALVSEIAGTTRDVIEDSLLIKGVEFRFIDTAGLRETSDVVEGMGIEKAYRKAQEAAVILYMVDAAGSTREEIQQALEVFVAQLRETGKHIIVVANKIDKAAEGEEALYAKFDTPSEVVFISARDNRHIEALKEKLYTYYETHALRTGDVVVTNARHHAALLKALAALQAVREGMQTGISGDLLAIDIRQTLHHLGEITGEINTEDLLGSIFSKFCIGK